MTELATCVHCGETVEMAAGYCGHCGRRQPAARDHVEHELPGIAAVTDRGRSHHRNEDAVAVSVLAERVVVVVCDGVSTSIDPDRASQAAADAGAATDDLDGGFDAARAAVLALPFVPAAGLDPPTTTYLAAVVADDAATVAGMGDCRAYWVDTDGARQLTVDDAHGHAVTRWISADADPTWRPSTVRFDIPGPGHLVLCSDGLWNYAADPEILAAEMIAADGDAMARARRLVEFANRSGGRDNISVIVVEIPLRTVRS
jgi:serine/threonine protein phosphatase PrpC